METVITRDTDILREYLAALDAGERSLLPFARLAAVWKTARLRRELNAISIEATDQDLASLKRELDDRLERGFLRRFASRTWGARFVGAVILMAGQQLIMLMALLATVIFVQFSPKPAWWNPSLPHEEPGFLFAFVFLYLLSAPGLALGLLFGGRFFRSWRATVPLTIALVGLSLVGTYLVARGKVNPVQRSSSIAQFARQRGLSDRSYNEWVNANWLTKEPRFKRDYEAYLRNGPGRWVTSQLKDDGAWRDSLSLMNAYLEGGQDPNAFREWLKYYLDRNRIYSEDRIAQEIATITAEPNQRMLGIWQVEPFLIERDERGYRNYFTSVDRSMTRWGLLHMALWALILIGAYFGAPVAGLWARTRGGAGTSLVSKDPTRVERLSNSISSRYESFPERSEISATPFFDAPFKLLFGIHRSYVGFAVTTSLMVFAVWAALDANHLVSSNRRPASQIELMRGHLLFGGSSVEDNTLSGPFFAQGPAGEVQQNFNYAGSDLPAPDLDGKTAAALARLNEVERRLEDLDYSSTKTLKEQALTITGQHREIDLLKSLTSQLQQTTSPLPDQITQLTTRAEAVEAKSGEALTDAGAAKQKVDANEKQLNAKLDDLGARTSRTMDDIGRIEDRTSVLATRAEAIEKELDRRARQIEARTEELGERTAALKEREDAVDRLQQAAFAAIIDDITTDLDDLDHRTRSAFYRFFNKNVARRDAESLAKRIANIAAQLRQVNGDQIQMFVGKLDELSKRVEAIGDRIK
jgi:hypothetical protein